MEEEIELPRDSLASNSWQLFQRRTLTYNVILQVEELRINKNNLDNIFIKSPTKFTIHYLSRNL